VGNAVAAALARRGDDVRVLVRDPERAAGTLPAGVEVARGDVTDMASLRAAVEGCELVFNAMGLPEQWLADDAEFDRVNARGTENVVAAAVDSGAARVIHTSTIDVFHAEPGRRFDESRVADYPKSTAYERSKQRAEELALAAVRGSATELVMVNPCAVYGPGPMGSASVELAMFRPVVEKRRAELPFLIQGGFGMVFTEGVAAGHLLAAERGRPGERYILCDRHVTLRALAEALTVVAGRGRVPRELPPPFARAIATVGEALARLTHRPPLMPQGQLDFLLWNAKPDSGKAQDELGWEPTPLEQGLEATLAAMEPPLA
jgi:nucleoside-diphosphate-sugar epimerase